MITDDELTDAFDKAMTIGPDNLNGRERKLYLIQDFILEWENGSFSGYLYNKIPNFSHIHETISAMDTHGLNELSQILSEAISLFKTYKELVPATTWEFVLKQYDPSGKLDILDNLVNKLDNYGIDG